MEIFAHFYSRILLHDDRPGRGFVKTLAPQMHKKHKHEGDGDSSLANRVHYICAFAPSLAFAAQWHLVAVYRSHFSAFLP